MNSGFFLFEDCKATLYDNYNAIYNNSKHFLSPQHATIQRLNGNL